MAEQGSFIKDEKVSTGASGSGLLALNWRFFRSLPLFLRLFPLSCLAILASSAAPSVFRWYSGKLSSHSAPERIAWLGGHLEFTLTGLVLITGLGIALRIAAWALFEISGMWSTQGIHSRMVEALSHARTTFFDENPSGRLINRLVRDYDEVRSTAVIFVGDFFNASVEMLGIAVIASLASPWAGLMILPLFGIFASIQYQRSAMLGHARALSAVATSRVLGRKTDLIEGREIFLLYGQVERLLQRMEASFREYVSASVLTVLVETWASFWIRISAEIFSLGTLVFLAFAISRHHVDATIAGVIISALFGITASIGWLDFATSLISRSAPHLQRVFEFVDLPPEEFEERAREPDPDTAPGAGPGSRCISFERYTMSYRRDTPVILRELELRIPLGARTALVGRTGSGKTSVLQALLRMVYVHSGDIRIDGCSVFGQEIAELRRQFGVVPQAPYLFAGTVRSNLDRLGTIPSSRLQAALEQVGLAYRLEHEVAEGGLNLSVGERQLVCLARVIAAERPIILMDEPTSGLDPETDARVSRIFATAFRRKTVVTIAHRRESLGGYDRLVEFSAGRVVWEGRPSEWVPKLGTFH